MTDANRAAWNSWSEDYQRQHGPQLNTRPQAWGGFALPESSVGALGDLRGQRVLELGCGGGQWSMFLARDGVEVVGLDLSEAQLRTAARLTAGSVPLVQAAAEAPPFAAASFDVVFCDHGGMTWADPFTTVPQVARLLRPGGRLVFNAATPWYSVCWDDAAGGPRDRMQRDYFGIHADPDEGDGSTSYTLPYGEWIRLFRRCGLAVEDLIELQPPADAETTYTFLPLAWARRWPGEHIWVVSKPA